jgi:hypothetical protein
VHEGWERTGLRFLAYATTRSARIPCAAFTGHRRMATRTSIPQVPPSAPRPRRSTRSTGSTRVPAVFYIRLPAITGDCPKGTQPLWRFFNKATINHRYTAEVVIRDQMRAKPSVGFPKVMARSRPSCGAELQ